LRAARGFKITVAQPFKAARDRVAGL